LPQYLKCPVEVEVVLEAELDDAAGTLKPLVSFAEGIDEIFRLLY
jgi:hypothetical protein